MKVAKVNFSDSIGCADFFYGTTLEDVRYAVEGHSAFDSAASPQYPELVELHFWKCYGGDVYEGYAIYNYLRSVAKEGVSVKCYIHGLCASIATLVALAASEVYMDETAIFMVHKPMADTGFFANADDHAKAADFLNKIQNQLVTIYTRSGKVTPEQAHALMNQESYLTADECINYGFVTGKITDELLVAPVEKGKALNYFKPQTPQNMAITPAEKQSIVDDVINGIKGLFKGKNSAPLPTQNLALTLAGDGGSIYVDTEADDIAQGDMVYTDEAMTTAAADGSYELADARTITVAAGAVESISTATDTAQQATDLAKANARIAELEAAAAEKDTTLTNVTNTLRTVQAKLKSVPGGGTPTPPGIQSAANKTTVTPTASGLPIRFQP